MTPLLIMVGIPSTVAAASDSNQIVAASTSGTYAHYRMGNVDFKMGLLAPDGRRGGGHRGGADHQGLRAMGNADFVIKITYVVMLGVVGLLYVRGEPPEPAPERGRGGQDAGPSPASLPFMCA